MIDKNIDKNTGKQIIKDIRKLNTTGNKIVVIYKTLIILIGLFSLAAVFVVFFNEYFNLEVLFAFSGFCLLSPIVIRWAFRKINRDFIKAYYRKLGEASQLQEHCKVKIGADEEYRLTLSSAEDILVDIVRLIRIKNIRSYTS